MKYYKIIHDNTFIGVACSSDFVKYQTRNHFYMRTDETDGEFIKYNGLLYRSAWMPPVPNEANKPFEQVTVLEITEEEYNTFASMIERDEEIPVEADEVIPSYTPIDDIDPAEVITVAYARELKIREMSATCRATIEAGFDITLTDGQSHHFSLDTQDQLNLITLSALTDTQEQIPYHADGEVCRFFTAVEMKLIIATATQYKVYHTTYYNALKNYINDLDTVEAIAAIQYGDELPDEYQTDVLKSLS